MITSISKKLLLSICVLIITLTNLFAQIVVSKKKPSGTNFTKNGKSTSNDPSSVVINTGITSQYGLNEESVSTRFYSESNQRGIKQIFKWNSEGALNGLGFLVSKMGTNFSKEQKYKLVIHELISDNIPNSLKVSKTIASYTDVIIKPEVVTPENYIYFHLLKSLKLNNGSTYGIHLIATEILSTQQISFIRSNNFNEGNGSQSILPEINQYRVHEDSPSYNFYLTSGEGSLYQNLPTLFNKAHLNTQKRAYINGSDPKIVTIVGRLKLLADTFLTAEPKSVTMKAIIPPSGSKNDFLSRASYWWPNPETKDGLPYIKLDGKINPEINLISDYNYLIDLEDKCKVLSTAYFFTNNELYAQKAVELLRVWFLNSSTKMNPNLNYSGSIPGQNNGIGTNVIDSHILTKIADWISLLETSHSMTSKDITGLKNWYTSYLNWMLTSKSGITEKKQLNNRGTYYDLQIASYALFTGNKMLCKQVIDSSKARLTVQLSNIGEQPFELTRAFTYSYSSFNISAWIDLAILGEYVGVDLWNYETEDGKSIKEALDWLAPYALRDYAPKLQPGYAWDLYIYKMLSIASVKYNDPYYKIRSENYGKLRNFAILKSHAHYLDYLFHSFNAPINPNSIIVSNRKPAVFKPASLKTVNYLNNLIVTSEESVCNSFGWNSGGLNVVKNSSQELTGFVQTFKWNSSKPFSGIGLLVNKSTVDTITQNFKLEILELTHREGTTSYFDVSKTIKTYNFSIHPTDVINEEYLYLELGKSIPLTNGLNYGIHIIPTSTVDQVLSFAKSESVIQGFASSTSLNSIVSCLKRSVDPSLNYFVTSDIENIGSPETAAVTRLDNITPFVSSSRLYPNPIKASNLTDLKIQTNDTDINFSISDIAGNSILDNKINSVNDGIANLFESGFNLQEGIYVVKYSVGNSTRSEKLIVE